MCSTYPNRYRPWSFEEREFIKNNYLSMDNKQIAKILGRTEDSIRKELNKRKLKRPRKRDLPKICSKRGRHTKINTVLEAINAGIKAKKKMERMAIKEKERERRLQDEALWAADFVKGKKTIKRKELIDPVIVSVPGLRINIQIDRSLPPAKISAKISSIGSKYGEENISIRNFKL